MLANRTKELITPTRPQLNANRWREFNQLKEVIVPANLLRRLNPAKTNHRQKSPDEMNRDELRIAIEREKRRIEIVELVLERHVQGKGIWGFCIKKEDYYLSERIKRDFRDHEELMYYCGLDFAKIRKNPVRSRLEILLQIIGYSLQNADLSQMHIRNSGYAPIHRLRDAGKLAFGTWPNVVGAAGIDYNNYWIGPTPQRPPKLRLKRDLGPDQQMADEIHSIIIGTAQLDAQRLWNAPTLLPQIYWGNHAWIHQCVLGVEGEALRKGMLPVGQSEMELKALWAFTDLLFDKPPEIEWRTYLEPRLQMRLILEQKRFVSQAFGKQKNDGETDHRNELVERIQLLEEVRSHLPPTRKEITKIRKALKAAGRPVARKSPENRIDYLSEFLL